MTVNVVQWSDAHMIFIETWTNVQLTVRLFFDIQTAIYETHTFKITVSSPISSDYTLSLWTIMFIHQNK